MRTAPYILSLLLLFPLAAEAKTEKKINLKPPKSAQVEDPGSAEHLLRQGPTEDDKKAADARAATVTPSTCTDSSGMIHKKGDAAYAGCLRTLDLAQPPSSDQRKSVGFTIGN